MSNTRWFVEPAPGDTADKLSRIVYPDNILDGQKCADGERRKLYELPSDVFWGAVSMRSLGKYKFRAFKKEGGAEIKSAEPFLALVARTRRQRAANKARRTARS